MSKRSSLGSARSMADVPDAEVRRGEWSSREMRMDMPDRSTNHKFVFIILDQSAYTHARTLRETGEVGLDDRRSITDGSATASPPAEYFDLNFECTD